MITFGVDGDGDARLSRSAINHSDGATVGGRGGAGAKEGAVTVWQGAGS